MQPEDIGVLAELLLRDPRLPSTMEAIRKDLQAQGWKMGKDRYKAISGRLTKAGHLARVPVYDPVAQRPTWVTRVYRNPANNQHYVDLGITESMPVGAEMREIRDPNTFEARETRISAGQSRTAGFPPTGPEVRVSRSSETRVSAGQSRSAGNPHFGPHPPHPPEEEDPPPPPSSSPTSAPPALSPQKEEEAAAEFSSKELAAAARFLQHMERWQAGAATARKCAPRLLRAMRDQGWPQLTEMDDAQRVQLEAEIFKNVSGAKSWTKCLYGWVEDLRLYTKVTRTTSARAGADGAASPGAGGRERCPKHPDRYRRGCVPCALAVPD
ncbi:hypothetical protein [Streptomyces alkaliterrae]|uniref:Uncharacterized protein n=1 Tax=Streptomyces alkaliterrae TaxID=2213162 RepID=A0A7W3ZRP6_9ACTN|nr:hypothetical protein [Streptomyces alkaliterrae]MBB1258309.1 hypothetical protein [Streptomyces alkaliterrae]